MQAGPSGLQQQEKKTVPAIQFPPDAFHMVTQVATVPIQDRGIESNCGIRCAMMERKSFVFFCTYNYSVADVYSGSQIQGQKASGSRIRIKDF
jgi:hypothetical protein